MGKYYNNNCIADAINNNLMQANQIQSKPDHKPQKMKEAAVSQFIKLTISTWNKDSHGLYDYESTVQSYKTETFRIDNSTIIYRDALGNKPLI